MTPVVPTVMGIRAITVDVGIPEGAVGVVVGGPPPFRPINPPHPPLNPTRGRGPLKSSSYMGTGALGLPPPPP